MGVLWVARSTCVSQQLQLLFESIQDRRPRAMFWPFICRKMRFSSGDMFHGKTDKNKEAFRRCCLCVSEVGASCAEQAGLQQQLCSTSTSFMCAEYIPEHTYHYIQQSLSFSVGATTVCHNSDASPQGYPHFGHHVSRRRPCP